ncbi:hypothetical protein [Weissella confusa]|uniref:Uncharacterized protein n=1 Tax=Weissella confusa TaxID=1583 RepID=A0AA40YRR9_WEICO|nr:hypothetical protein [Weissella confusa]MBJ7639528.1 hypothetical protein [Weissella confusa]
MTDKQLAHPKWLLFFETLTAIGVIIALLRFFASLINGIYHHFTGHTFPFVEAVKQNTWQNYLTLAILIIGILGTRYLKTKFK